MKTLDTPGAVDELVARLGRLSPATERRWGTMTAHEMLCHLADSYRSILGDRHAFEGRAPLLGRTVMRFVALHTPLEWPKGVKTRAEVDPKRQGTRPQEFAADRDALVSLLRRFASTGARYGVHPMFGTMTRREWLIWGYRHPDHHLRQFGL